MGIGLVLGDDMETGILGLSLKTEDLTVTQSRVQTTKETQSRDVEGSGGGHFVQLLTKRILPGRSFVI